MLIAHDKYIFTAPMWEFSFPAVLKKYLDITCAAKQTFSYGEAGIPEGLLKTVRQYLYKRVGEFMIQKYAKKFENRFQP